MKKNFKRKKRQLQWLHNWLNIIYYCFWEIIHLKDWDQFLDSCQNQPNNTHLAQEPGLWAIHTFHPRYVAPSHVPSLSGVFSYTFHSYVVTLQGYMPSIRNEKNPFLSPDPSRGVFFPARPDLPIVLSPTPPQSSPVRPDHGPSSFLPLHATPIPHTLLPGQVVNKIKRPLQILPNLLFYLEVVIFSHSIFLSFTFGQLRAAISHFISKELCLIIFFLKYPEGFSLISNNRLIHLGLIIRFFHWLLLSCVFILKMTIS